MFPDPLCGERASPFLAAGLPLMKTVELPAATAPWELPQHPSRSVVTLPTVAAGLPLIKTSPEHPAEISPLKGSGLWGGTWPECSPAVVPSTLSFSLAASGILVPPSIQIDHTAGGGQVSGDGHVAVDVHRRRVDLDQAALDLHPGALHIDDDGV